MSVLEPRDRIEQLAKNGKITPQEAKSLLGAMAARSEPSWLHYAVNPFLKLNSGAAAAIGLVLSAAQVAASRLGIRYDGFIDLHVSRDGAVASFERAALEAFVAWVPPAIVFWVGSRVLGGRTRLVDFVGVTGFAHVPYVVATPFFVWLMRLHNAPSTKSGLSAQDGLGVAVALGALAWMITWLYQGFVHASNLQGAKRVSGFVFAMIAAETLAKLLLVFA